MSYEWTEFVTPANPNEQALKAETQSDAVIRVTEVIESLTSSGDFELQEAMSSN